MNNITLHIHKKLIEECKLGNRNAQYSLYKLYVDAMFNVAMRMVKVKPDAEDIIQESFIEAFKKLDSYRYESTFGAWLKRIVVNKSINHLKIKRIAVVPLEKELCKITDNNIETNVIDERHKIREIKASYGKDKLGSFSLTGKKGIISLTE